MNHGQSMVGVYFLLIFQNELHLILIGAYLPCPDSKTQALFSWCSLNHRSWFLGSPLVSSLEGGAWKIKYNISIYLHSPLVRIQSYGQPQHMQRNHKPSVKVIWLNSVYTTYDLEKVI